MPTIIRNFPCSIQSKYRGIAQTIKLFLFDLSLCNICLIAAFRTFRLPLFIYKSLYFRMGKNARIVHKAGRLHLGCKWDIGRYKQSEFKICDNGILEIRGDMRIYTGCSIDICPGAFLSFGSGYINNGVRIAAFNRIILGDNVAISENVTFRDSDNHIIAGSAKSVSSPIVIGDHVWIGLNATILKGVNVGEGSVIAANSLVNKDVPPYTLVGGIPARVLKENVSWK
jgi:acetyltransferase-like isoleucine patch superfamily enzyme